MKQEGWWEGFFHGPWEQIQLPGYPEKRTAAEVTFMVDALRLTSGAHVLDIPCGEGRHTIELARRGFDVTGIDFNVRAIAAARKRAEEAAIEPCFQVGDMRKLDGVEEFDAAVCFFGSFGYFCDEENFDFLRRVARALKPGGSFLLDGHVTESLYPKFRERDWSWVQEDPPARVMEERRINLDEGRVESTWTWISPEGTESRDLSIRIYGFKELRDLMRIAGFSTFRAYETGTLEPFRLGSSRLALVATKGP